MPADAGIFVSINNDLKYIDKNSLFIKRTPMNAILLFILLALMCVSLYVRFIQALASQLCRYLEANQPQLWCQVSEQAKELGAEDKWPKAVALQMLLAGRFSAHNSDELTQFKFKSTLYRIALALLLVLASAISYWFHLSALM